MTDYAATCIAIAAACMLAGLLFIGVLMLMAEPEPEERDDNRIDP